MKFIICVSIIVLGGQAFAKSAFEDLFKISQESKYIFSYRKISDQDLNFQNINLELGGVKLQVQRGSGNMKIQYCFEDAQNCKTAIINDDSSLKVDHGMFDLRAFKARSVNVNCGSRSYEIFFSPDKKIYGVTTDNSRTSFAWYHQEVLNEKGKPVKDANGNLLYFDMLGALQNSVIIHQDQGQKMVRGESFKTIFTKFNFTGHPESEVLDCQVVP